MPYQYKNIDKLIEELEEFHDIEFEYRGKKYSICPINGVFIFGGSVEPEEFVTIEAFIDNCKIEGMYLRDIITEVDVYLH